MRKYTNAAKRKEDLRFYFQDRLSFSRFHFEKSPTMQGGGDDDDGSARGSTHHGAKRNDTKKLRRPTY